MNPKSDNSVKSSEAVYIGPERRMERRRLQQSQRVGILLKNCGLDRRGSSDDRRRVDSSWFVTSKKVANQ